MKRITLLTLSLTAVACGVGTSSDPADEYRDASPSRQSLTLGVGTPKAKKVQGLGGGPVSGLYLATAEVTRTINAGVRDVLDRVEDIIKSPPAVIDQNHAAWGPITDPLSPMVLRFLVERDQGGMRYVLQGKSKQADDSQYVGVLEGTHLGDPSTGAVAGRFLVNRDALRGLNGDPRETGGTAVEFARSELGDLAIRVGLMAVTGPDAQPPTNAVYVYNQVAGGDGAFEFQTQRDLNDNGVLEHTAIRARWNANGAGQAEAAALGGDLQQNVAHLVECWDTQFELTFRADSSGMNPPLGDPATCRFASQPPPAPPVVP